MTKCHVNFFGFFNSDFNAEGRRKSHLGAKLCFKRHFLIHLTVQSVKVLKIVILENKMSPKGGRGERSVKCQKVSHVLFECPLN